MSGPGKGRSLAPKAMQTMKVVVMMGLQDNTEMELLGL